MPQKSPTRVRVEWRDQYRQRVRIYISPNDAHSLEQSGAASYKPRSKSEMNLRDGLQIVVSSFGAVSLEEVLFVGAPRIERAEHHPILEKWHRLRLNCQSWTRFAACRDPYQPTRTILSVA